MENGGDGILKRRSIYNYQSFFSHSKGRGGKALPTTTAPASFPAPETETAFLVPHPTHFLQISQAFKARTIVITSFFVFLLNTAWLTTQAEDECWTNSTLSL